MCFHVVTGHRVLYEQNLNDIEHAFFAGKGVTFRIFRFLIIVLSYVVFKFIHCSSLVARVMASHSKKE